MNRKASALAIVLTLFAVPVSAAEFITTIGEYKPSPMSSVRVYEEAGKIQYRVKSGTKSGGPTKPLIEKSAAWFIYPESDKRFWASHSRGQLELIEGSNDGIAFSSSSVVGNLVDSAPLPVRERMKEAAKK